MIKKIHIENFRSIKTIEFEPKNLCSFIGENNVGKSNILSAIDLLLGEKWPANRLSESDIHNHDESLEVKIQIFFDEPIKHEYYRKILEIDGFALKYNFNEGTILYCLDETGGEVLTQYGKGLYLNNAIRGQIPCVFIGVNRNLERELSGSQWTLFGKLLKEIEKEFLEDDNRKYEYQRGMNDINDLLRIESFNRLEGIIEEHVKKLTGFVDADLRFVEPTILDHYKNLDLIVKESYDFDKFSALVMGAGLQSAIVIALIQAYKELRKTGAILLIEEPEVYLHPHARRYFYSLIKDLSGEGHQIFYTTHSTEFVDLPNYETICIVRKTASIGTKINQVRHLPIPEESKEELKLLTQFDAARNELFFARKVLLVEGQTERFSLPHLFVLKGIEPDINGISVMDVGGKENLVFFIKILKSFSIPFVVLHDEDSTANNYATYHDGVNGLNAKIERAIGDSSLVFRMDPDFEGIFGLSGGNKIRNAIKKVRNVEKEDIPTVIDNAINKLINITKQSKEE
ncbi:hypothetical protein DRJ25_05010 [Candidatus Woesearchaeota archaeon]|nr:MAG: hypothetical protein DRJ25_05010 [Candidatus Woesearchaeota archaeon]